jgi:putative inorganic carbon (hco3(-)) transporter
MGFFLLLLLNAILFIRPAEVVPALIGLPLYNICILGCFACAYPLVVRQLQRDSLAENPITACVIGMLVSVVLSHLSHASISLTVSSAFLFSKNVLYFLLLVGLVDSTHRLRRLIFWLGWLILILATLALLQYHEMIDIPSLESTEEGEYDEEGNLLGHIVRLGSTGIYNNPNSLSRILVTGMMISVYWLGDRRSSPLRVIWLLPLAVEGYALTLTQSRGGLLDLTTSLLCLLHTRFGAKYAALLSTFAAPIALAFKGRQTDITLSKGTGHQRLEIWAQGWELFKHSPIFGIGMDQYVEAIHYVAHNSFFHCFAELGILGGSFFTGMYYLAIRWLLKFGGVRSPIHDAEFRRLGRYLAAIIGGEAVGQLSITRSYEVPTYLLLGLAAVYLRLAAHYAPASVPRLSLNLVGQIATVSLALLFFLYMLMKL